jgi:hypothetical protein
MSLEYGCAGSHIRVWTVIDEAMELLYGLNTSEDNRVPSTSSSKLEDKQLNYILLFLF